MEEDISETKNITSINYSNNNNKRNNLNNYSFLKEIDKIINKSKNQLEEINLKKKNDNFYQCDKSTNNNFVTKSYDKKNISSNNNNYDNASNVIDINDDDSSKLNAIQNNSDIDKNFDLERINLKLTSDLTLERVKVRDLTIKLKIKDQEISSLKQQINYTQMNFYNKQKQYQNFLEQNDKNIPRYLKIVNTDLKINQNSIIVKAFFNFFNKYLDLFNQLNILKNDIDNYNNNNMLLFIENDLNDMNLKNAKFAINTLDLLIEKLVKSNNEYKDMGNNNIDKNDLNMVENIENIKSENIILKEQLQKLNDEFNNIKNDIRTINEEKLNKKNVQNDENINNSNNSGNEDNKNHNKQNENNENNEKITEKESNQNNNEIIINSSIETFGNINYTENDKQENNTIKDENENNNDKLQESSTLKNDNT